MTETPIEISKLKLPQKAIDAFVKKIGSIEKLNDKVKELTEQTKLIGVSDEDLPKAITHRLMTYFSKSSVKLVKYEIVPISVSVSDFGNKKKYDSAMKLFQQNPEMAIETGCVDKDGNPIENGKFGVRKIDPTPRKSYDVMCRKQGEQNFNQVRMNVSDVHAVLSLFSLYDVECTTNTDRQTNQVSSIGLVPESTFQEKSSLNCNDIQILMKQSHIVLANKDKFEEIVNFEKFTLSYFWGSLRTNGFVLDSGINTRVSLCPDIDLESIDDVSEIESIDCWVPELLELPGRDKRIVEGAINVLAIGRLSRNKDRGNLTMNIQGMWVDPRFIETSKATPIGPDGVGK